MKAIRVHETGGPEVLRFEEVDEPRPGAGELLIDVEAIGLNFIEIYQREGLYQLQRPFTPGSEAAGTVRALGENVRDFSVGDRVVSQSVKGAYAERAIVAAEKAVRVPDGVDTKTAAAVWLQGLTAHYLSHTTYPLKTGDSCVVHAAAGGVGLLLCQMAKRRGAFVIGTASTPEKRELARNAGADEVIDYTSQDFAVETRRLTSGEGVNVVYDSVGKTTFDKSLDCLKRRGLMALFGQSSGPVPPFDPQILNRKGSLFLTRPTLVDYVATRDELLARAKDLLGWVARGQLSVRVGAEFPLDRTADAHRALTGRKTTGKVLILPRIAALFAIATSAALAGAQSTPNAVVRVIARDSTLMPVAGAEVTVMRGLHDVVARGKTDELGRANLAVSVNDSTDLDVTLRKIGYARGDRFFSVGPHDTARVTVVVGPPRSNQLNAVKVTAERPASRFMSYHLDADEIEAEDRPSMTNGWEVVKQLRPSMLESRGACDTGAQEIWVNGERIRLPLYPTGMAAARARVGVPPRARFSYAPVSVLSDIAPEHIEEITYHDCFDHSMAVVGTQNAIFVVLKPGVVYQENVGSFVVDSVTKPSARP